MEGRVWPHSDFVKCACVVLSKDTDVTMILALAETMHGSGVVHVLGESVIEIDVLLYNLSLSGVNQKTLATVYAIAGCDFTPGTYGVGHNHYLNASIRHGKIIESIEATTPSEVFEMLTLLAYLEKRDIEK